MLEKLHKLSRMSGVELASRFGERVRREADRLRFHRGSTRDPELAALIRGHGGSIKTYLHLGPARRFYSSTQNRKATAEFISEYFPDWMEGTLERAGRLCEHRFDLLGYSDLALGGDIDWHRDPVSGYEWPRRYWADYDLVHHPNADAKVIHELNRHQHLPRLAQAYFLTGDEPYAREAVAQMESWIEQNRAGCGVNWQSSLEIAIRTVSWMWTIFLLRTSESLEERSTRRIMASLFAQCDHIYSYPSVYTSPNTHLICEAAALFIAGMVFRELPRARRWREFGAMVLMNEMERQVSPDGVYCELSSCYHCYAADCYLQTAILAHGQGAPFPQWMLSRLSQMFEFILQVQRSDGTIPLLGDDDGGRFLALAFPDYRSYSDGLGSAALFLERADFKHQSGEFHEESLWLLGTEGWHAFELLKAEPPAEVRRSYPDAGYFVQRSGWDSSDSHLVFDCGGLGLPTGGHGHDDALSLTLSSNGREILIDPGTYVYNCKPEWRGYFRSAHAHNTVIVDGQSPSEPGGTFAWKRKATARLRNQLELTDIDYIDAERDSPATSAKQIHFRRRVIFIRPNYWIVLDNLRGSGEHRFDFLYHFAPGAQLFIGGDESKGEVECRAEIGDTGLQMFLYGSSAMQASAICGQTDPIQGWTSQRYGAMEPSPVLCASMYEPAPVSMMSFLMPGSEPAVSRRFNANTNRATAAAIRDGDYDDIAVMCNEDTELHLVDCVMRGEFFWMRLHNGSLQRLLAVNAHSFSYAGEMIFENSEAIPYVQAHVWDDGMVIERGEREGKVYVRDLRDRQFQRF